MRSLDLKLKSSGEASALLCRQRRPMLATASLSSVTDADADGDGAPGPPSPGSSCLPLT